MEYSFLDHFLKGKEGSIFLPNICQNQFPQWPLLRTEAIYILPPKLGFNNPKSHC